MVGKQFPLSFWKTIAEPRHLFAGRGRFSFVQMIIIVILLNILILIPIGVRYWNLESYDMGKLVPGGLNAVTENTYHILKQGSIENGQYEGKSNLIQSGQSIIAINPSETNQEFIAKSGRYCLILTASEWTFTYPSGRKIKTKVNGNKELSTLTDETSVKEFVSQQWFQAHKNSVVIYLLFSQMVQLLTGYLIMVLGGGIFLILSKKLSKSSINTLRQGMGLMLSCLILPSMLTAVLAMTSIIENSLILAMIPVLAGFVLVLIVWASTNFRDSMEKDVLNVYEVTSPNKTLEEDNTLSGLNTDVFAGENNELPETESEVVFEIDDI